MAVMKNIVYCKCKNMELRELLLVSYSSFADRDCGARLIHHHPEYFTSSLELACAPKDNRETILSVWILEKYDKKKTVIPSTN